ncbi:hypothetical protein PV646_20845 [Streptomyces sp. ID05-26A]|nr:hypothetical protein [Streptomyces sp. ID05-26A]
MRLLVQQWIAESARLPAPAGRWAIQRRCLDAWAFSQDVNEVFAIVRPGNTRAAATARNNGMHRVGETTKYFGIQLQVFRLRVADPDSAASASLEPPERD